MGSILSLIGSSRRTTHLRFVNEPKQVLPIAVQHPPRVPFSQHSAQLRELLVHSVGLVGWVYSPTRQQTRLESSQSEHSEGARSERSTRLVRPSMAPGHWRTSRWVVAMPSQHHAWVDQDREAAGCGSSQGLIILARRRCHESKYLPSGSTASSSLRTSPA